MAKYFVSALLKSKRVDKNFLFESDDNDDLCISDFRAAIPPQP